MTGASTTLAFMISTLVLFPRPASAAAPPANHPLAALAWCVGGTWVAQIGPPDGAPRTAECTFTWSDNGRVLKYTLAFKGPEGTEPRYEGMYFWHPGKKQIAMVQVDREGNVTEAVVKVEGNTMTQDNIATHADGTSQPQRVVVEHMADTFALRATVKQGEEWTQVLRLNYRRVAQPQQTH